MDELLPFDRLKPKQRTALISLLRGSDYSWAARDAGVSVRTIHRWRRLPDFQTAYRAASDDFYTACRSQVVAAHAEAFEALRRISSFCSVPGEAIRSAMFLIDYLARPEMSESLARRGAKTHRFNKLVQFAPGKPGQTETSDTKTLPIAANLDLPADDAG